MEIKKAPPPTGFRTAYLKAVADVAEMNHQNAREKRRNAEEEALKKALREPAATAQNVPLETVSPLSDPTGSPPVELESGKLAPGQYGGIDQFGAVEKWFYCNAFRQCFADFRNPAFYVLDNFS